MMIPGGWVPAFAAGQDDPITMSGVSSTTYDQQRSDNFVHPLSIGCTQNLDGNYVLSVDDNTYAFNMKITGSAATGNYPSGAGPYLFTWHATVGVVGHAITISVAYDAPSTYTTILTGIIAPDGSMSGTGTNGITDWNAIPGHVTGCNE